MIDRKKIDWVMVGVWAGIVIFSALWTALLYKSINSLIDHRLEIEHGIGQTIGHIKRAIQEGEKEEIRNANGQ